MKRRSFLGGVVGTTVLPGIGACTAAGDPIRFEHGVASGDPLPGSVILWTRVSGTAAEAVEVEWEVADNESMHDPIASGTFTTGPDRDYTVKADAAGLPPGQPLYYRFHANGTYSPVGHTKTTSVGRVEQAAFAVVSCSNFPYGFFHVYREIANRNDLDAVIHLGDYIYEYGLGEYATEYAEALDRIPDPPTEIQSLDEYRRRHAQYKADPDSIAMHASLPLIAVWDDHELTNDAWRDGAQNHQPEEGSWPERRDAAIQAWLEWMPVRASHDGGETQIFRNYRFGDLLTLTMLDTRLYGRDMQPDVGDDLTREDIGARLQDPSRRLLGDRQEQWLRDTLSADDAATWQIIGQQVLVSPLHSPDLEPLLDMSRDPNMTSEARQTLEGYIAASKGNPRLLFDTWDGYPLAREDFLATLAEHASNPVVLSGDLHTSLAGNLIPYGSDTPVAVEFMTGSVTSPGFSQYLPEVHPGAMRDATLELNPWLRYMETDRRGWVRLAVSHESVVGEWNLVSTVHDREYTATVDRRLEVRAGAIADGLQPS